MCEINVKGFGAVGDGVVNDHDAFVAASAVIKAAGGGKLVIPAGVYKIGKQTFAGVTGLYYSYKGQNAIDISNCPRPVIIEGHGATLKIEDGLKFGSYDPVTGEAYHHPTTPLLNSDYQASIGSMINLTNNASVKISGIELDGNIQNAILGGSWGDSTYQIVAYGLRLYGNLSVHVEDVHSHHHCLDGIIIGATHLTEIDATRPHTLVNCRSLYNARQGLSVVGCNNLTAIGCDFSYTGRSHFHSHPGAGVDLEAEQSIVRNVLFMNSTMENNYGAGMVAGSGKVSDVLFLKCRFVGTTNWAIWPNKPRMRFEDCVIAGPYVMVFASDNRDEACQFIRSKFSDEVKYGDALYKIGLMNATLSSAGSQKNVRYEKCAFVTTRSRPGLFYDAILRGCTFLHSAGTDYVANRIHLATFQGAFVEDCTILDRIEAGVPADGYYILTDKNTTTLAGRNFIDSAGGIRWWSWSDAGGGYTGHAGILAKDGNPHSRVPISKGNGHYLIGEYGEIDISAGKLPTSGDYEVGDLTLNASPVDGGPAAWVTTVAGSPGTRLPVGIVGAVRIAAVADETTTISDPPTKADVEAVQAKLNQLLAATRASKLMAN